MLTEQDDEQAVSLYSSSFSSFSSSSFSTFFFLPSFGVGEILHKVLAGYRLPSAPLASKIKLVSQMLTSFTLVVTKSRGTEEYSSPIHVYSPSRILYSFLWNSVSFPSPYMFVSSRFLEPTNFLSFVFQIF